MIAKRNDTKNRKERIKKEKGERCVYCNTDNPLILSIDHILPLCRGGSNKDSNKQVACVLCNFIKGGLSHEEYLNYQKILYDLKKLEKIRLEVHPPKLKFFPNYFPRAHVKK